MNSHKKAQEAQNGSARSWIGVLIVALVCTTAPGYKLVNNPNYPLIVEDYRRTFQILKSLRCDVFLAPHGNFFELATKSKLLEQGNTPNPFIDSKGYMQFIEDTEKAFEKELQRQSNQKLN